MVRKIYYLRRKRYESSRQCVDDLFEKQRCLLSPRKLTDFEKGFSSLDEITTTRLANLFEVSTEELIYDDGISFKDLKRKFEHRP